jgi:DNA replication and repair protein RecF
MLAPRVQSFYRNLAGNNEEVSLRYLSPLVDDTCRLKPDAVAVYGAMQARLLSEEMRRGTTLTGPHRDDLQFQLNGSDVKQYASQGQQRSLMLAMKMAEIAMAEEQFAAPPILLLDDLASELDRNRTANMLAYLHSRAIQVFITTTDPASIPIAAGADVAAYRVEAGAIYQ